MVFPIGETLEDFISEPVLIAKVSRCLGRKGNLLPVHDPKLPLHQKRVLSKVHRITSSAGAAVAALAFPPCSASAGLNKQEKSASVGDGCGQAYHQVGKISKYARGRSQRALPHPHQGRRSAPQDHQHLLCLHRPPISSCHTVRGCPLLGRESIRARKACGVQSLLGRSQKAEELMYAERELKIRATLTVPPMLSYGASRSARACTEFP
ncbi:hypothetical protein B0H19DRAFT_1121946 [Mycena capillaripes]|nr:hypothetical protein B0H19DRAFT_1121946 [Mycena capillaripes]